MNRIKNKFDYLSKNNKSGAGFFLTAGYPDLKSSEKILTTLPEIGVDFIEIGIPFSDPMADGPLIQESSEVAIKKGMNVDKCFDLVKKIRQKNKVIPIILMGYFNPIHYYGKKRFIKNALKTGVDGLIIVDLPIEEDNEFYIEAEKNNLTFIRLITPTTNVKRLKLITKQAKGFIYYVSVAGITGTKSALIDDVGKKIKEIKKHTKLPVIVGFGIKTPEQAFQMSKISDGIVVGSALVEKIKETKIFDKKTKSCIDFIKTILTKF